MKTKIWLLSAVLAFSGLALTSSAGFASPLSGDEDGEGEAQAKSSTVLQPALEVVEGKDHSASAAASSSKAKGKADAEPEKFLKCQTKFPLPGQTLELSVPYNDCRALFAGGKSFQLSGGPVIHEESTPTLFSMVYVDLGKDERVALCQSPMEIGRRPVSHFKKSYPGDPFTVFERKDAVRISGERPEFKNQVLIAGEEVTIDAMHMLFAGFSGYFERDLTIVFSDEDNPFPFSKIVLAHGDRSALAAIHGEVSATDGLVHLEFTNFRGVTLVPNPRFFGTPDVEQKAPTGPAGKADAEDSGDEG